MATKRLPPLTYSRLRAISMSLNAILAGEDGEGDWDPAVSREALQGALEAIQARLADAEAKQQERADRLSAEMEQDYLEQTGECARGRH